LLGEKTKMSSTEGNARYSGYSDLIRQQINQTADFSEALSPPRALTEQEILATLDSNFEYYIGIRLQRDNRFQIDPVRLSTEQKRAHFLRVVADISHVVNRRFIQIDAVDVLRSRNIAIVPELAVEDLEPSNVIPFPNVPVEDDTLARTA